MRETAYRQLKDTGEKLLEMGINTSHSGNLSIRGETEIYITRTGARLDRMTESDVIGVPLDADETGIASVELPVHRAIYANTAAKAILHSHPPYTIAFSMMDKEIYPVDNEAFFFLGRVPVLNVKEVSGSIQTGEELAVEFNSGAKIAVIVGHGSFAVGENMEKALHWTTTLERSCQIGHIIRTVSEYKFIELVRKKRSEYMKEQRKKK